MKKLFRIVLFVFLFIALATTISLFIDYVPDKPFTEVKEKWAYEDSQFIEIDGMPVHYRIRGEGAPVVLIHGTGASLHTWEDWTTILERDFRVISLDLPGYGLTGPNKEGTYGLEYYAQFLDTFLGKIGVDTLAIVGNSLGGGIAWTYTAMYPEKVEKLILLDAIGYPSNKEPPLAFKLAKNPLTKFVLLKVTPKSLFETSIKDVYHNKNLVTPKLIDQYYELYLREGNRQAFLDRVNKEQSVDSSQIQSISCPTLIQWGKHDRWVPVENAYKFERDIPNAKLIIYEDAGHVPMEEIPKTSGKDALDFLLE